MEELETEKRPGETTRDGFTVPWMTMEHGRLYVDSPDSSIFAIGKVKKRQPLSRPDQKDAKKNPPRDLYLGG